MKTYTRKLLWSAVALTVMVGSVSLLAQGQWGSGPIKVAIVTKGHNFDRDAFFNLFDALGKEITWTHVQHPAALEFFDPAVADTFDVYVFYDAPGRTATPGPDGKPTFEQPNASAKKNLVPFLQKGKGLVFFHHSPAAWNHTWPEYVEMIGMACDWGNDVTFMGKTYPRSGFLPNVKQRITVVDKTHPVTQGVGEGFEITDEVYLCPVNEKAKGLIPLLRTDFEPVDSNFTNRYPSGWRHPKGSQLAGWVRSAEKSPLVYLQNGHDRVAWENPAFRTLLTNAIRWTASQEARDWAAKNPTRVRRSNSN
jgi:type 1 glutamine amidotransferase